MIDDFKHVHSDEPVGFFIWQEFAGAALWVVFALALIFWPWLK